MTYKMSNINVNVSMPSGGLIAAKRIKEKGTLNNVSMPSGGLIAASQKTDLTLSQAFQCPQAG